MDTMRTRRPDAMGGGRDATPTEPEDDDSDALTVLVDPRLLGVLDLPEDAIVEVISEPEVFSLDSRPQPLPPRRAPSPIVEPALLATALFGAVVGCFTAVWWVLG